MCEKTKAYFNKHIIDDVYAVEAIDAVIALYERQNAHHKEDAKDEANYDVDFAKKCIILNTKVIDALNTAKLKIDELCQYTDSR